MKKIIFNLDLLNQLDVEEHAIIERWRYIEKNRQEEFKNPKHRLSSV
jgi:hypothetical protein